MHYFIGPGKSKKRKKSRKQKNPREFEENLYDSESTDIISDTDMPPLPSVHEGTYRTDRSYLVRQNGFVGVDGFNAAMQKLRNECVDNFPDNMYDTS